MPQVVSVILPNYNHGAFLPARLESIVRQTYRDYELLLLDDASTDGSQDLLRIHAERYGARLILNEKNSGSPFVQWNRGVRESSGRYLWIAESDDFADPKFLESLVPLLDEHPRVGIAYARSWLIDEQSKRIRLTPPTARLESSAPWERDFVVAGRTAIAELLSFQCSIPNASGVLFRREAFVTAGGADEAMRLCGDWDLYVKILSQWDLSYCAQPLNFFRAAHAQSQRKEAELKRPPFDERIAVMNRVRELVPLTADSIRDGALFLAQSWVEYALRAFGRFEFNAGACADLKLLYKNDPFFPFRIFQLVVRRIRASLGH